MNILIVYGSQFGTTGYLARVMAQALADEHEVRVLDVHGAASVTGAGVDLLLVGAPTQFGGRRLLVRPFLQSLREHGFAGVAAAAFDTRSPGPGSGSAAIPVGHALADAGCRIVAEPEGFIVNGKSGLAAGEEDRAARWAKRAAHLDAVTA